MTPATAQQLLQQFLCDSGEPQLNSEERQQVRQALATLLPRSDYQTIGICANTLEEGLISLNQYLAGFGYDLQAKETDEMNRAEADWEGGIYLKYNTRKASHYCDRYSGTYRGVLIAFQSEQPEGVVGTYGHFPLDLYS